MNIQIDIEKMSGVKLFEELKSYLTEFLSPHKSIDLYLTPTVGVLGIHKMLGKSVLIPSGIISSVQDKIRDKELEVCDVTMPVGGANSPDDFDNENLKGIKYLMLINSCGNTVEDTGLYMANVGFRVRIFDLLNNTVIKDAYTIKSKGYGTSKSGAISEALYKAKGSLIKTIKNLSFY